MNHSKGTEEEMNEFKTYHPIVNFIYFAFVIGFSMFFMHPGLLAVSFGCAFIYSKILKGKTKLIYVLPVVVFTTLLNPMFNHSGMTVISYLPSGNPLTLESVLYGFSAGLMLSAVILWFSCYNEVMTSDKFIYLFGRIIPSLSLIISMTLRFIPKFSQQLKAVINAQKCIGRDISSGNIIQRAKNGLHILSVMVTWALENSVETADSMKSRGYGLKGRTAYSIYTFDKRDGITLFGIVILGLYVLWGGISGKTKFSYFPQISGTGFSSVFIAYFMLLILPTVIEIWEVRKWNATESKI